MGSRNVSERLGYSSHTTHSQERRQNSLHDVWLILSQRFSVYYFLIVLHVHKVAALDKTGGFLTLQRLLWWNIPTLASTGTRLQILTAKRSMLCWFPRRFWLCGLQVPLKINMSWWHVCQSHGFWGLIIHPLPHERKYTIRYIQDSLFIPECDRIVLVLAFCSIMQLWTMQWPVTQVSS